MIPFAPATDEPIGTFGLAVAVPDHFWWAWYRSCSILGYNFIPIRGLLSRSFMRLSAVGRYEF
jgi:hypothetical protein